jgi:sugar/nucleoside kinase (ribokinase family)
MRNNEVVVAGHICLDIIPTFSAGPGEQKIVLGAGKLIDVGPAIMALGGAVANTGLALHRLGCATGLMGKVGDDPLGQMILDMLRNRDAMLVEDMLVEPGAHTSYSLVISPPGTDRIFFHHAGANDTFEASEIALQELAGVKLVHFGYPPLMRRLYRDGGRAFADVLQRLKEQGATISLDMALPDPNGEAGHVDWLAWLARVLPYIDIFMPSVDELAYMLSGHTPGQLDEQLLSTMAQSCLQWGTAIVALKLGNDGLYLRTTTEQSRLEHSGRAFIGELMQWRARELFAPCFQVDVVGTTGAGDCTIAGFLMGVLQGQTPEEALTSAVAVGACSVERADATSGIIDWASVQKRIKAGWKQRPTELALVGWQQQGYMWRGPTDREQR